MYSLHISQLGPPNAANDAEKPLDKGTLMTRVAQGCRGMPVCFVLMVEGDLLLK